LLRPGDRVLDLGCFPGSWLLYAAEQVGPRGRVCGVDLKPVTIGLPPQVHTVTADILAMDRQLLPDGNGGFTVVLSDMAPATTGNKRVDSARSADLCRAALQVAIEVLAPQGRFVCKIFQGEDFKTFVDGLRPLFKKVSIFKPQSCRKASKEIYIIAMDKC
jgi:23S rRNA (uridine2552-2'-O)-methyltransferase